MYLPAHMPNVHEYTAFLSTDQKPLWSSIYWIALLIVDFRLLVHRVVIARARAC